MSDAVADDEDEAKAAPAPKAKKKAKASAAGMSLFGLVGTMRGKYGNGIIGQAGKNKGFVLKRYLSGIMEVDIGTGGGHPVGRFIRIFGPSSKGKSTLMYKSFANIQRYCRYCQDRFRPDEHDEVTCGCDKACRACEQPFVKVVLDDQQREALVIRDESDPTVVIFDFNAFFDNHTCGCKGKITERCGVVRTVLVDVENSAVETWLRDMGIDTNLLFIVIPEYCEQAIDLVDVMLESQQVDVIGIDSLAAMTPLVEIEASHEEDQRGIAARKLNKAFRTWVSKINALGVTQRKATVFVINQERSTMDPYAPETTPGGKGQGFASSIDIKITANYAIDREGTAIYADTKIHFKKNKTAPPQYRGTYRFYYKGRPGHPVGSTNEEVVVLDYALKYGIVRKTGTTYAFENYKWATQKKIVERFQKDLVVFDAVRDRTLEKILAREVDAKAVKTLIAEPTTAPKKKEPDASQRVRGAEPAAEEGEAPREESGAGSPDRAQGGGKVRKVRGKSNPRFW